MTAPADAGLEPLPGSVGVPQPGPDGVSLQPYAPLSATEAENLRGQPAGFASRFIAFIVDCAVSIVVFELVLGGVSFAASVLTGSSISWSRENTWVVVAFFAWQFLYYAYYWTSSGKTLGMVLLGVQVVDQDGSNVSARHGLIRTLAFPLSFIILGLGFVSILLRRDRRALHDLIADTEVVYSWDAREARLRSLARQKTGQGTGRQP
jgi:uncharacterized RDD family membrane protein YckC